ncbi:hypothetical protein HDV00_006307 [Rhizophlyctis rosea]|nr:hypothetical protein HDV00_006307 [Rhizophlyctis rosea]
MGNVCSTDREARAHNEDTARQASPPRLAPSPAPAISYPPKSPITPSYDSENNIPLSVKPSRQVTAHLPAIVPDDHIEEPQPIYSDRTGNTHPSVPALRLVESFETNRTPSPHSPSHSLHAPSLSPLRQPSRSPAGSFTSSDPYVLPWSAANAQDSVPSPRTPGGSQSPFGGGGFGGGDGDFNGPPGGMPRFGEGSISAGMGFGPSFGGGGPPGAPGMGTGGRPPYGPPGAGGGGGPPRGPPGKNFLPPHLTYIPNIDGEGRKRALSLMKKWTSGSTSRLMSKEPKQKRQSVVPQQSEQPFWATMPKLLDDPVGTERSMLEWNTLRLRILQTIMRNLFDGLYCAPVGDILSRPSGGKVLDCSAGSGLFASELHDMFPTTQIHLLDFAPPPIMFPSPPSNITYRFHSLHGPLPFPDNSFNFVRLHHVFSRVPKTWWPKLMSECVRVCKKGGYVEFAELDWPDRGYTPGIDVWMGWMTAMLLQGQMDLEFYNNMENYLAAVPDIEPSSIRTRTAQLSYSPDPTNLRLDWNAALAKNLMVVGIVTTEGMIVGTGRATKEEYDRIVGQVAEELDGGGLGGRIKVVWGQKA